MEAIADAPQASLTHEQKKAVVLLSMGTFLEYFDLMLYVHMAVLLNELFFPQGDPHTTALLSALAFCSTFVFRPFGAFLFGWIGDKIGRKATVIITTAFMAFSCLVMANMPTYAQVGITASWLVTICRVIQGMSSMGEIIGAELYLTEMTKPPLQYPIVALIGFCSSLGGTIALSLAAFSVSFGFNWRFAFWFGAGIAIIGSVARTALRETPEFVDAKRRIQNAITHAREDSKDVFKKNIIVQEKVNQKTSFAYFLMQCAWPVCFYLVYIHCGNILKSSFGYSSNEVIYHNLIIAIVQSCWFLFITYLSYYVHPLKILKTILSFSSVFILFCPYILTNIKSPFELLAFQLFCIILGVGELPAGPIFFKHFPIFKRFTYASITFALARALMYLITSFGFVYLTEKFDHWGLLVVIVPVYAVYTFGLNHYKNLEVEAGNYY